MSDFDVSLAAVFSELRCRKGFPSTIQLATGAEFIKKEKAESAVKQKQGPVLGLLSYGAGRVSGMWSCKHRKSSLPDRWKAEGREEKFAVGLGSQPVRLASKPAA
ncbi:predicted protein [Histoplasma capsulatum var. duboisii H88]|uniref:Predicted protein n=2 Tax=Ajellomyces capsulatus TaxID=5037 RepID=F0UQD8_AJEC8|nr:predicted protein [Histoplasma capsulatum H143]EGC47928.1 predicted protein [Histoplasma capsulatum var. duboisii H88]